MKASPLSTPLVILADNRITEISLRLERLLPHLGLAKDAFAAKIAIPNEAGKLHEAGSVLIAWSIDSNIETYRNLAKNHRTVFVLDVDWPGTSDPKRHGIQSLTKGLLKDDELRNRCIIILKTTTMTREADRFRRANPFLLRTVRSNSAAENGRIRIVGADYQSSELAPEALGRDSADYDYEGDVICRALFDLQEEALFDALHEGALSAHRVKAVIEQFKKANYYGAFRNSEQIGNRYEHRLIERYGRFCIKTLHGTPINLGLALNSKPEPTSFRELAEGLTTDKLAEVLGLVSALVEYGDVAAAEFLLFQLVEPKVADADDEERGSPKSRKRKTTGEIGPLSENAVNGKWNPKSFYGRDIPLRKIDRPKINAALIEIEQIFSSFSHSGTTDRSVVDDLHDVFDPLAAECLDAPGALEIQTRLVRARETALKLLRPAATDLIETALAEIEKELEETTVYERTVNTGGKQQRVRKTGPSILTLEFDCDNEEQLEYFDFARKRIRLLNRDLIDHPVIEAERLLHDPLSALSECERIVEALASYVQCPAAIAALAKLKAKDGAEFAKTIRLLKTRQVRIGMPSNIETFDKAWRGFSKANKKSPKLFPTVLEPDFDETFKDSGGGAFLVYPLLHLLVSHLALLDHRIRSFCVALGGDEEKGDQPLMPVKIARDDLRRNLRALWRDRQWHLIFSEPKGFPSEDRPFIPDPDWVSEEDSLVTVLKREPGAKACWDDYKDILRDFEIIREGGKLRYRRQAPPLWLRFGNVSIPADRGLLAQLQIIAYNRKEENQALRDRILHQELSERES